MPRVSPRLTQKLAMAGIWGTGIVTVLILLVIIAYVLVKGAADMDLSFLTTPPKGGTSGEGGISTVIVCTLYLIGLTMAISVPLGIGAALAAGAFVWWKYGRGRLTIPRLGRQKA